MKKTIRGNIETAYSLHDMKVTEIRAEGNSVAFQTQSGILKAKPQYAQINGHVEFHNVQ